ncbi:MAG: D-2-hydroxyacid dehydrogenase [Verrucomicrobia bacterium]|nr:D-2-hydroxyacid dehydrogenase [Verrucomicrobiota bacterium]
MSAKPNIVVLDGHTLNPGDLSWDPLRAVGDCVIHERTTRDATVARAAAAEIVLTNKVVLDRTVLSVLPRLRYVGVLATGYNVVDLAAARERGLVVTNVPDYSTRSVVQLTFALLLELTHHVGRHTESVRAGRWSRSADFCYWETPLLELDGLTLGIVGFGRIGRAVAQVGSAFGMKVLVHTPRPPVPAPPGIEFTALEDLFRRSDVVSLHCPLTADTQHLVDARRLALMKPSAFLLNTGRGPLVDETALAEALNSGRLAGAAVDVLSSEPPPENHPLLTAKHCVITPHLGWATKAARERLMQTAVANVRAFLSGQRQNVVS